MRKLVSILWVICTVSGFICASYGVLRESFATTATETAFSRSAFDSQAFDTGVSDWQNFIVNIGLAIGLLPEQRTLKLEDRKLNAVLAIVGVFLLGCQ